MAKESLGYVKLEWTCPSCGTRNPGPQKTCQNCGTPQPEDVKFEQAAEEKLIDNADALAQAKQGPDIYCFYCGTRNPATAKTCSQCGGNLSEGEARRRGEVLGAHRTGPVKKIPCPSCGFLVHPDVPTCPKCGAAIARPAPEPAAEPAPSKPVNRWVGIGIALVLLALAGVCAFLFLGTDELTGRVQTVQWERTINIEQLAPVERETWRDEVPNTAVLGVCTQKVYRVQDQPAENAKKICGTPYTVDQGNGYGEAVQDCQFEVYADWCSYTVDEWQVTDRVALSGDDFNPQWPQNISMNGTRREGARVESYEITFNADGDLYTYTADDVESFNRFQIGSRWILEVNKLGAVVRVQPAGK